MKRPAQLLFPAYLATVVAAAMPEVNIAADNVAAVQELTKVTASGLVTTASWSRQTDNYTLRLTIGRSNLSAENSATAAQPQRQPPDQVMRATGDDMRPQGIVNVADALLKLVPNGQSYRPVVVGSPGDEGMTVMDRSSFFIGKTIAGLRGPDPAFHCGRITLADGRRGGVDVWLLKADGTAAVPVGYDCTSRPTADGSSGTAPQLKHEGEVSYRFALADSEQAMAVSIRIGDDFYVEKLQPLTSSTWPGRQ